MENVKYILGDLVKLNGKLKVVRRTETFDFRVSDIDGTHITLCTAGEIIPIKLTPQILEANGWKKGNLKQDEKCLKAFYYPYSNENSVFCIRYYESVNMFVPYVGITPLTDKMFMYVHQLQHLLFGLGLPSELKV